MLFLNKEKMLNIEQNIAKMFCLAKMSQTPFFYFANRVGKTKHFSVIKCVNAKNLIAHFLKTYTYILMH